MKQMFTRAIAALLSSALVVSGMPATDADAIGLVSPRPHHVALFQTEALCQSLFNFLSSIQPVRPFRSTARVMEQDFSLASPLGLSSKIKLPDPVEGERELFQSTYQTMNSRPMRSRFIFGLVGHALLGLALFAPFLDASRSNSGSKNAAKSPLVMPSAVHVFYTPALPTVSIVQNMEQAPGTPEQPEALVVQAPQSPERPVVLEKRKSNFNRDKVEAIAQQAGLPTESIPSDYSQLAHVGVSGDEVALPSLGSPKEGADSETSVSKTVEPVSEAPLVQARVYPKAYVGPNATKDADGVYRLSKTQEEFYRDFIHTFLNDGSNPFFTQIQFKADKPSRSALTSGAAATTTSKTSIDHDANVPGRYTLNLNPNFWGNSAFSSLHGTEHLALNVLMAKYQATMDPVYTELVDRIVNIIQLRTGKKSVEIKNAIVFGLLELLNSDAQEYAVTEFEAYYNKPVPRVYREDMQKTTLNEYTWMYDLHMRLLKERGVYKVYTELISDRALMDGKVIINDALLEKVRRVEKDLQEAKSKSVTMTTNEGAVPAIGLLRIFSVIWSFLMSSGAGLVARVRTWARARTSNGLPDVDAKQQLFTFAA